MFLAAAFWAVFCVGLVVVTGFASATVYIGVSSKRRQAASRLWNQCVILNALVQSKKHPSAPLPPPQPKTQRQWKHAVITWTDPTTGLHHTRHVKSLDIGGARRICDLFNDDDVFAVDKNGFAGFFWDGTLLYRSHEDEKIPDFDDLGAVVIGGELALLKQKHYPLFEKANNLQHEDHYTT